MKPIFNIVFKRLRSSGLAGNASCAGTWKKLLALQRDLNEEICWELLTTHLPWLINNELITGDEIRSWFSIAELNARHIYTKGSHAVRDGFAIGLGEVTLEASGHSKIILFEKAFCAARDTSFVTGFHNSFLIVTNCFGYTYHHSKAIARNYARVEAHDESFVKAEDHSYIIRHNNATVERAGTSKAIVL